MMDTIRKTILYFFLALLIQLSQSTASNLPHPPSTKSSIPAPVVSSPKPVENAEKAPTDLKTLALDLHNNYRSLHGAPPLKLNASLNGEAQSWSDTLVETKKLELKSDTDYNQNLYEFDTLGGKGKAIEEILQTAVEKWYSTKSTYNPAAPEPSSFTQLVWKATTDIGVGVSTRNGRTVIVVCYYPVGNVLTGSGETTHFRENVQV